MRSYLNLLDCETLMSTVESMKINEDRIINPMAYIMSTIINAVCEKESDLILSLPAQYVSPEDLYAMDDYSEEGDEDDDDLYTGRSANDIGLGKSIRGNP